MALVRKNNDGERSQKKISRRCNGKLSCHCRTFLIISIPTPFDLARNKKSKRKSIKEQNIKITIRTINNDDDAIKKTAEKS